MDFSIEIPANLWVLPRGIERQGEVRPRSVRWTARYGSVVATSRDIGTSDGMNERGLVAKLLGLVASKYTAFDPQSTRPGLAVSLWAQYALDNFATVAEAVEALRAEPYVVVTDFIPGTDKFTIAHLSLSDATGDNAILENIDCRLMIHHDPSYGVMTNDPPYDEQLAILKYWEGIPGQISLPGTHCAADRFVRAVYYIHAIPQTDNTCVAVASALSVIRNCSVPYGISTEGFPNLSSTRWRTVADHKNLVYYYEGALTPNTLWVEFAKLDFAASAPVRKLDLSGHKTYAGETSAQFATAQPFKFQGISPTADR